tara:strand:+ start:60036 stop:60506 length:471 start_codon:yes stop_codon:yes gene_type:complete
MKYIKLSIFCLILTNCTSLKQPNEAHGVKNIILKSQILKINVSNKNDVLKLMGYQPLIDPFDKNLWSYFEIVIEKNKLGKKKFKKNNILIIKFNNKGIINRVETYNLSNMQNIVFSENKTKSLALDDSVITKILNSSRKRLQRAKKIDDDFSPFPK